MGVKSLKLIEAFRDKARVEGILREIKKTIEKLGRVLHIMEFCGGHTHAIIKHGIDELLKGYVNFVHGPGCPVCVLPIKRVDLALHLTKIPHNILCTYGDLLRLPGSGGKTLLELRSQGFDVRGVYSCLDCIQIAKENPNKKVIFFAIGFETTTPQTALLLLRAKEMGIKNLMIVSNHVVTPAVLQYILKPQEFEKGKRIKIDALIGPGHVSTIIGIEPYEPFAREFQKPIVISGFEPLDILQSVYMIANQFLREEAKVENQYKRFVNYEGNPKAKKLIYEVFDLREEFEWRGLGTLPYSGLRIKDKYKDMDAEEVYNLNIPEAKEHPACICGDVVRGIALPMECKLFGKICTPHNPIGACMVSSEGVCHAYFKYKV